MVAALVSALALAASNWPAAPLERITMFREQSMPFGPIDRVAVEVVPAPGYHFSARASGADGEATTIQWAGGQGTVIEPLPEPSPQKIMEVGVMASAYVGPTIFQARLTGNEEGTAVARLHLALCGDACYPIDYTIDRPVVSLPIRRPWSALAGFLTLAACAAGVGSTMLRRQFWLTWLTKLRPASS